MEFASNVGMRYLLVFLFNFLSINTAASGLEMAEKKYVAVENISCSSMNKTIQWINFKLKKQYPGLHFHLDTNGICKTQKNICFTTKLPCPEGNVYLKDILFRTKNLPKHYIITPLVISPSIQTSQEVLEKYYQKRQQCFENSDFPFFADISLTGASSSVLKVMTAAGFISQGNNSQYKLNRCYALDNEFIVPEYEAE